MVFALFHRLTEAEKDALLRDQQKLTGQMAARISELEALVGMAMIVAAGAYVMRSTSS